MNCIIEKDEMGIINYYNQNRELIRQDYRDLNEIISFYYENNKINKISNGSITLELDYYGNPLIAFFNNGLTCYFAYKHSKGVFIDYDGKYLGDITVLLDKINSQNRLYIVKNLLHKLENSSNKLINTRYNSEIFNVKAKISYVNNLMINDTINILKQDKYHNCQRILKEYDEEELRKKRLLLQLYKNKLLVNRVIYENKKTKITKKYAKKRRQLKTQYDYANEYEEIKAKQNSLMFNQSRLDNLLKLEEKINNEYLSRRK